MRWLLILLNCAALAVHLDTVSHAGVECTTSSALSNLKYNCMDGRATYGSLLSIELCKILINGVSNPGIAIFGIIQANLARLECYDSSLLVLCDVNLFDLVFVACIISTDAGGCWIC